MLWGSDWPHPAATAGEVPMPHDAVLLHGALAWCDTQALADRVLQGNPAALYGFGP
jgi:D-galactarolactone isomerase